MKAYHIFFLVLKVLIVVQFVLILLNRQRIDSKAYLITEIVFKTALGIYIEYFMFYHLVKEIEFEDKLIMSFAGGLLIADAYINDLPILLKAFGYGV